MTRPQTDKRQAEPLENMENTEDISYLCSRIGVRLRGTPNEHKTMRYLKQRFKGLGLDVEVEGFRIMGWELLKEPKLAFLEPKKVQVPCKTYYYALPTPKEGIRGYLKAVGKMGDPYTRSVSSQDKYAIASESGKHEGYIIASSTLNEKRDTGGYLSDFFYPVVAVGAETKERLEEWMSRGEKVKAWMHIDSRFLPGAESYNVIGTLKGTKEPDKWIIIGAHYDSVINCPGAVDDASGVQVLINLAEEMVDEGYSKTIKFIAFGSEEYSAKGSLHYVMSLKERGLLDNVELYINLDAVGAADRNLEPHRFRVHPEEHLRPIIEEALRDEDVAEKFGWRTHFGRMKRGKKIWSYPGVDYQTFSQEGIPTISAGSDRYDHSHQPTDEPDKIGPRVLGLKTRLTQGILRRLATRQIFSN